MVSVAWSRRQSISGLKAVCNPVLHMGQTFLLTEPNLCLIPDKNNDGNAGMCSQMPLESEALHNSGSWDLEPRVQGQQLIGHLGRCCPLGDRVPQV